MSLKDAFEPLGVLGKLLGLTPSKYRFIPAFILLIAPVWDTIKLLVAEESPETVLVKAEFAIQACAYALPSILYIVRTNRRIQISQNVITDLEKMDILYEKVKIKINYNFKTYKVKAYIIVIFLTLCMAFESYVYEYFEQISTSTGLVFLFHQIVITIVQEEFCFFVSVLKNHIEVMRKNIYKLTALFGTHYLVKQHSKICELAKNINSMYSIELLFSFTRIIYMLTSSLHLMLCEFFDINCASNRDAAILMIFYTLFYTWEMLQITSNCHYTTDENEKFKKDFALLSIWGCEDLKFKKINVRTHILLSPSIRFTCAGYFEISNRLVMSIISSVVAYLVIIIQIPKK